MQLLQSNMILSFIKIHKDLVNVNEWKMMFDPSIILNEQYITGEPTDGGEHSDCVSSFLSHSGLGSETSVLSHQQALLSLPKTKNRLFEQLDYKSNIAVWAQKLQSCLTKGHCCLILKQRIDYLSNWVTNPIIGLCTQGRLRSAWAFAQSDPSLHRALNGQLSRLHKIF